ncbi:hypothetical protein DFH11DRAFT_1543016 [Phellopilus nigrolimitatus]|nr:hypothetical protein DFH11DRAFT_1543016 [Phellopilus nigrolimitatus]
MWGRILFEETLSLNYVSSTDVRANKIGAEKVIAPAEHGPLAKVTLKVILGIGPSVFPAFGETLQCITKVKLDKLEAYAAHASNTVADAKPYSKGNLITHFAALVGDMKAWSGPRSSDMNLVDMERYLEQLFEKGIYQAEAQFEFESTRYVSSPTGLKILARNDISVPIEGKSTLTQDGSEKVSKKETPKQKEKKLETLIFETKEVDDLFPSKGAQEALEKLRKQIKKISEDLPKHTIQSSEIENVIESVLQSNDLSGDKQATPTEILPSRFDLTKVYPCDFFRQQIRGMLPSSFMFFLRAFSCSPLSLSVHSRRACRLTWTDTSIYRNSPEQRLICEKATLAMGNSLYGSTFVDAVIRSPVHEGGYGKGGVPDFRNHLTVKYRRMMVISDGEVEHASTTEHVIFKKEKELILRGDKWVEIYQPVDI